ncbi:hypothetical protein [Rickettsia conorii]|uniref:hypothetical protein n=1 Tax=Rickettsia conorii TaxID=781 RepID=UPI003AF01222
MPQLKIGIFKKHKYCKNIKTTTQSNANYPLKKKTTEKKIKPHGKIYKYVSTKIFGHRILNFLEQIMTHNYKSSILD